MSCAYLESGACSAKTLANASMRLLYLLSSPMPWPARPEPSHLVVVEASSDEELDVALLADEVATCAWHHGGHRPPPYAAIGSTPTIVIPTHRILDLF